jgi:hypothetical protein
LSVIVSLSLTFDGWLRSVTGLLTLEFMTTCLGVGTSRRAALLMEWECKHIRSQLKICGRKKA